jgi:hypothetical protein
MIQELCPLCEGEHLETCHIDGDWVVKFYFGKTIVSTSVIAGSKEQAIRFAETEVADQLGLEMIVVNSPDEVDVELCGVYSK